MSSLKNSSSLVRLLVVSCLTGLALHCSSGGGDSDGEGGGGEGGDGGDAEGGNGAGEGGRGGSQSNASGGSGVAGSGGGAAGSNQGGTAGKPNIGGGGSAGSSGGAAGSAAGGTAGVEDKRPLFSFFVTSKDGILSFAQNKNEAKTPEDVAKGLHLGGGLGGDLGGLAGADKICTTLAQRSNPGDKKTWRAFLSAKSGPNGMPVHAIERIGKGPWHNFKGVLLAMDIQNLIPSTARNGGRPRGGDAALAEMFTDENGDKVRAAVSIDNHDTLTGSDKMGRFGGDQANMPGFGTCNDWTSVDTKLAPPMIGHSWPRTDDSGRHWISEHPAGGCGRGIDYILKPSNNTPTVGAGGGYGGFYCFAVTGM